jgi:hypothetical protein
MAGGDDYGRWGTTAPVATGRSRTSSPTSWYNRTGPRGWPGGQIGVTRTSRNVRRRSGSRICPMPGRCRASQAPGGMPGSVGLPGYGHCPPPPACGPAGGASQQAPGHRLIALGPAPARADDPVEQGSPVAPRLRRVRPAPPRARHPACARASAPGTAAESSMSATRALFGPHPHIRPGAGEWLPEARAV